jgi:hypothetical protein
MNDLTKQKIEQSIQDRKSLHLEFKKNVKTYDSFIEWHLEQAMIAGVKDEEIYETIDIAIEMVGGPAAAYSRFVLKALEFFKKKHIV